MQKKYIYTSEDVFKHSLFLRYQTSEHMRVLYLNNDNELIHSIGLTQRNQNEISFMAKDIFRVALICNASGIILVHNHPSGNVTPSKEDILVTKRLIRIGKIIGIEVVDHVIVSKTQFTSVLHK